MGTDRKLSFGGEQIVDSLYFSKTSTIQKFLHFFLHCTKFLAPQRDAKFVLQESGCVEFLGHLPNLEEHLSDPTPEGHLGSPETEQLSAEAG